MRCCLPVALSSSSLSRMCLSSNTAIKVLPEPANCQNTDCLRMSNSVHTSIKYSYCVLLLSFFEQLYLVFSWVSNNDTRILFCNEAAD